VAAKRSAYASLFLYERAAKVNTEQIKQEDLATAGGVPDDEP